MKLHRNAAVFAGLALGFGGLFMVPAIHAAKADSEDISKLLSDANSEAIQLRADSDRLWSFTRSNSKWESYAGPVNDIKEHINSVGKLLAKLSDQRSAGSVWQQTAIDRIDPLLRELAANTSTVIDTLNNHKSRVHTKEFQDYVQANNDLAANLAHVIGDFVDYGNTKTKLEKLSAKLEMN